MIAPSRIERWGSLIKKRLHHGVHHGSVASGLEEPELSEQSAPVNADHLGPCQDLAAGCYPHKVGFAVFVKKTIVWTEA